MSPRGGRPPGASDARERILAAARELFAQRGFQQTSLRAIATEAGVDVALISHYFDNKRGLFVAAIALPHDPADVLAAVADVPDEQLGSGVLRAVLTVWSSPGAAGLEASFRSAIAGDESLVRDMLQGLVLPQLHERVEQMSGDADRRLPLAFTQIAGIILLRQVIRLEPLTRLTVDEVVAALGPNVDRLLTGPLPD